MSTREDPQAVRATVLFVDDEPAMLRATARALRGAPFDLLSARSGDEALALMRACPVDVIVSDLDMPEMSGLELLKLVREEFPATQRMLLTGAATVARAIDAINEGEVRRFFLKPFDVAAFSATMENVVARMGWARREAEYARHAAARAALRGSIDAAFPGTFDVTRGEGGEIVVDPAADELDLLESPVSRRVYGRCWARDPA